MAERRHGAPEPRRSPAVQGPRRAGSSPTYPSSISRPTRAAPAARTSSASSVRGARGRVARRSTSTTPSCRRATAVHDDADVATAIPSCRAASRHDRPRRRRLRRRQRRRLGLRRVRLRPARRAVEAPISLTAVTESGRASPAHADRGRGGRRGRGLGAVPVRGRRPRDGIFNITTSSWSATPPTCATSAVRSCRTRSWVFGAQRGTVGRDGSLDWVALGFGSRSGPC